jgi:hypothetical protein
MYTCILDVNNPDNALFVDAASTAAGSAASGYGIDDGEIKGYGEVEEQDAWEVQTPLRREEQKHTAPTVPHSNPPPPQPLPSSLVVVSSALRHSSRASALGCMAKG